MQYTADERKEAPSATPDMSHIFAKLSHAEGIFEKISRVKEDKCFQGEEYELEFEEDMSEVSPLNTTPEQGFPPLGLGQDESSWSYDEDCRRRQLATLTKWLTCDIIGYQADVIEMAGYAQRLVDFGFHSPDLVSDLCTPDDVASFEFMKPVHKRLFLLRGNLKSAIHVPIKNQ